MALTRTERRTRLKMRIRKLISGTNEVPRLSVFRSNKEFYAQIIDDTTGKTLASVSSLKDSEAHIGDKKAQATLIGKKMAERAKDAGIGKVKFDRNGYLYHGRVKAFAEAAREGGLIF